MYGIEQMIVNTDESINLHLYHNMKRKKNDQARHIEALSYREKARSATKTLVEKKEATETLEIKLYYYCTVRVFASRVSYLFDAYDRDKSVYQDYIL